MAPGAWGARKARPPHPDPRPWKLHLQLVDELGHDLAFVLALVATVGARRNVAVVRHTGPNPQGPAALEKVSETRREREQEGVDTRQGKGGPGPQVTFL